MMKKLFFAAAIAAFGFTNVNAQEEESTSGFGFAEGDIIVEGTVAFGSESDKADDNYKASGFDFSPQVGYFLSDKVAVGVQLSVGSYKEEDDFGEADGSTFGAGAYARYYFLEAGERFKTYAGLSAGFDSEKDVYSEINVGIDLGLNYFVKENIVLTFGLDNLIGFSSLTPEGADDAQTSFGLSAGEVNNPFGGTASFGLLFKF